MTYRLPLSALLLALSLTACAPSTFKAEVTRFNAMSAPVAQGTLIAIEPLGLLPKDEAFGLLAAQLADGFSTLGYKSADGAETEADVIIRAHFTVDKTPQMRDESAGRFGIGVGGGSRGTQVGVGANFNLQTLPVTIDTRQLVVTMEDARTGTRLFEGRVNSQGQGTNSERVLGLMIKALLKNFPGTSGETVNISLPTNE